jgi:hypothetical protein
VFRLYGMRHVLSALALSERQPITAWLSSSMGSLIGKRQRRARIACALVRLCRCSALRLVGLFTVVRKSVKSSEKTSKIRTNFGMAGSRTQARGFQPIPSVTESVNPSRFSVAPAPRSSLPIPTPSDRSVTKCDTEVVLG